MMGKPDYLAMNENGDSEGRRGQERAGAADPTRHPLKCGEASKRSQDPPLPAVAAIRTRHFYFADWLHDVGCISPHGTKLSELVFDQKFPHDVR